MKLSDLIGILTEALSINGDMEDGHTILLSQRKSGATWIVLHIGLKIKDTSQRLLWKTLSACWLHILNVIWNQSHETGLILSI